MALVRQVDLVLTSENSPLQLPAAWDNARNRDRLLRATAHLPFEVFTIGRRGLRTKDVVGLLDLGDLQIQILPKAGVSLDANTDNSFLLDLLASSGSSARTYGMAARTSLSAPYLFEAVARATADRILLLLRHNPPRRYYERDERSAVLKGRPQLTKMVARPPASDHLLMIRHAPLQLNSSLSQVIRATVRELIGRSRSMKTLSILYEADELLSEVAQQPLAIEMVERISLSAFERDWSDIIELAAALCRGRFSDPTTSGSTRSFAFLFPLYDLFERALRRCLHAFSDADALRLELSSSFRLLRAVGPPANELFRLRPDFVLAGRVAPYNVLLVADAKWKRADKEIPTSSLDRGDLYQLTAYMSRWGVQRGALIFPMADCTSPTELVWSREYQVIGSSAKITVAAVNIRELVIRHKERRHLAGKAFRKVLLGAAA